MVALTTQLEQLEEARLVAPANDVERAYLFKHALTQEAAYLSLLLKKRRAIHRQVAESYEEIYPDRLDEYASRLAEHYAEAGNDVKTVEYAIRAGDRAMRLSANQEAAGQYARALVALARLPETPDHRRHRIDTLVKQVSVTLVSDVLDHNWQRLQQAEALLNDLPGEGQAVEDRARRARVQYWQGRVLILRSQMPEAVRAFQAVLALGQELGDEQLLAIPSSALGRVKNIQGLFGQAVPLLSQAVALLEREGNWADWTFAQVHLGLANAAQGDYKGGLAQGQRALARALELGNPVQVSETQVVLGLIYYTGGDSRALMQTAEAAIQAAKASGVRVFLFAGLAERAYAASRLGDHKAAQADLQAFKAMSHEFSEQVSYGDWYAAGESQIALQAGNAGEAVELAKRAVALSDRMQALFGRGLAERVWGQALTQLDPTQSEEAVVHFAESLRILEAGAARLEAARTHAAWGRVLGENGNVEGAREHLERAAAQFQASGLEEELEETRQLIIALHRG